MPRPPLAPTGRATAVSLALAVVAAASLSLIYGCGSSIELLTDWGDPALANTPLQKVMVISVKKDPIARRVWEDAFVTSLGEREIRGVPSYTIWSEGYPDSSTVREVALDEGYDAVLVSIKVDRREETRIVPGSTYYESTGGYWDAWGRYHAAYRSVNTPSYTETDEILIYRSDIWLAMRSTNGGRLAWSGFVEARNPGSVGKLGRAVADQVVRGAAARNIL